VIINYGTDEGADFRRRLRVDTDAGVAVDLSTYSARMQIRRRVSASTTLVSVTDSDAALTLSSNGNIDIFLTNVQVALLGKENHYDIEIEDAAGTVSRVAQGLLWVLPEGYDAYGSQRFN
jgi:hypothetical protein